MATTDYTTSSSSSELTAMSGASTDSHPQVAPEASRFKLTLNAKGQLQYEVSFSYTTVDEMLTHLASDALAFDSALRRTFRNIVPPALNGGE